MKLTDVEFYAANSPGNDPNVNRRFMAPPTFRGPPPTQQQRKAIKPQLKTKPHKQTKPLRKQPPVNRQPPTRLPPGMRPTEAPEQFRGMAPPRDLYTRPDPNAAEPPAPQSGGDILAGPRPGATYKNFNPRQFDYEQRGRDASERMSTEQRNFVSNILDWATPKKGGYFQYQQLFPGVFINPSHDIVQAMQNEEPSTNVEKRPEAEKRSMEARFQIQEGFNKALRDMGGDPDRVPDAIMRGWIDTYEQLNKEWIANRNRDRQTTGVTTSPGFGVQKLPQRYMKRVDLQPLNDLAMATIAMAQPEPRKTTSNSGTSY